MNNLELSNMRAEAYHRLVYAEAEQTELNNKVAKLRDDFNKLDAEWDKRAKPVRHAQRLQPTPT